MKTCGYCRLEKENHKFGINKQSADGLRRECKECRKKDYYANHEKMLEEKRKDYEKHREERLQKQREDYQNNPETKKNRIYKYRQENPEKFKEQQRQYTENNYKKIQLRKKEYQERKRYEKNKEQELFRSQLIIVNYPIDYKICTKCHTLKHESFYNKKRAFCRDCSNIMNNQYRKENGDELRALDRQKRLENPEFYREKRHKLRQTEQYKSNKKLPESRLISNMTQYIRYALSEKGLRKDGKATMKYVGCTREFFQNHLASQFQENMTWDNYGNNENNWSVDHYIPKEAFNLLNPEEQEVCFHWTNCQPMWHIENEIKQDTMPDGRKARDTKAEYSLEDKKFLIAERIRLLNLPIYNNISVCNIIQ